MQKYLVIQTFRDKFTQNIHSAETFYETGDEKRASFLIESGYLKANDEHDEPLKNLGGGYYELPNGEKVRGKEKALRALKKVEASGANESRQIQ
ncbi:hypothetical protein [Aneurinibacillus aneurinilyticus]|uniref:hypothetical protein n=1 Tax=Aneurinibacillus aneurinilyticus TaxID=1391 RepID=UPI00040DA1BC|nr:hypothetical protein [Aneurinibacillus aneurinilyticus]MED0704946.1 hypothetical protein [Aneurinibacillus aneurinilyticus]MED0723086.1 hypothetical protein [Aneurinibacillus aneurinilyticus]MED0731467.1 hypothetical protein [Aneurinibacillus aneurinilyticus]MED0740090.1 hypothetical protein [Aneurinibacillus aneurinilyticus]